MPEEFDYIERYLEGKFSQGELLAFEKRIEEDATFAELLAFYISTLQVAREKAEAEKQIRFRQLYDEHKTAAPVVKGSFRRLLPYISAAAAIAGIVISLFIFNTASPTKLADQYIHAHLQTMSVAMGNRENTFQTGVRLYNEGKLPEALMHFENVLRNDPSNSKAKENAGIVSLRLKQYDQALTYFSQLENFPGLYANPGKFYHALTLMKRNLPGDTGKAKILLEEVVSNHLDMDSEASKLLEKL